MALSLDQAEVVLRRLAYRWADGVNRRDMEFASSVYADDGVWSVGPPKNIEVKGRQQIIDYFTARPVGPGVLLQMVGGVVVTDFAEGEILGRCMLQEHSRRASGGGHHLVGYYEDHVVERDGQWGFLLRRFHFLGLDETTRPWQAITEP